MYKILFAMFAVVLVTNPLSAQVIQPEFFKLWDMAIEKAGWITTTIFTVYIVAMAGYLFAKVQLKDAQKQNKQVAKAKVSNKRQLDGMKYIAT